MRKSPKVALLPGLTYAPTLYQNLHWKLGQLAPFLIYFGILGDCGLKNIFSRKKKNLFCFSKYKVEIAQNFNSIRQLIEKLKITIVWMGWMKWTFVRFHEIQFQKDAESFSFLSWKTKKTFIPKKDISWVVVNIKTKKLCLLTQFSVKLLLYTCKYVCRGHCSVSKKIFLKFMQQGP